MVTVRRRKLEMAVRAREDARVVPLSTLIGADPSVARVVELRVGEGMWRDAEGSDWHPGAQRDGHGRPRPTSPPILTAPAWREPRAPSSTRPTVDEARKRRAVFRTGLAAQVPEALACLENGFAVGAPFYAFPKEHSPRIRSMNGRERLHGEVKPRTRAAGAFPDRASAIRVIAAVASQVTRGLSERR